VEHARLPLAAATGAPDPAESPGLVEALYADLHRLAQKQLARGARNLTLGTTTLLHEAYLDMASRNNAFAHRGQFMAYACRVMRTLIIDHVRNRKAQKRGGQFEITSLDVDIADPAGEADRLARIGAAIDELAELDPLLAQIVDLRFFCGFTFAEIAAMRDLSERSVQRYWQKARLYLHDAVEEADPAQP
jgi:RNA polymerase sigma factor (TIGR02999 family)